jgi:hypothetical protein
VGCQEAGQLVVVGDPVVVVPGPLVVVVTGRHRSRQGTCEHGAAVVVDVVVDVVDVVVDVVDVVVDVVVVVVLEQPPIGFFHTSPLSI